MARTSQSALVTPLDPHARAPNLPVATVYKSESNPGQGPMAAISLDEVVGRVRAESVPRPEPSWVKGLVEVQSMVCRYQHAAAETRHARDLSDGSKRVSRPRKHSQREHKLRSCCLALEVGADGDVRLTVPPRGSSAASDGPRQPLFNAQNAPESRS